MKITIALALTCLAGLGWGQEQARGPEPSAEALERIRQIEQEAETAVSEWQAEQTRLREEHAAEVARAKEEGREEPARPRLPSRPDFSAIVERLVGWADQSEGEDAALYLTHAVRYDGLAADSRGRAAFERLLEQHPTSPSLARLGPMFPGLRRSLGDEEHGRALEVLARSPDPDVRGWAILARHAEDVEKAAIDSERYRLAKAALLAAREEARDEKLRGELAGPIELRETLSVGAVAPDIEGLDLDGETFKLSDYRGKVILLSFWGDW